MPMVSCLQHWSRVKSCIVDWLCCRQAADPPAPRNVEVSPIPASTCADPSAPANEEMSAINTVDPASRTDPAAPAKGEMSQICTGDSASSSADPTMPTKVEISQMSEADPISMDTLDRLLNDAEELCKRLQRKEGPSISTRVSSQWEKYKGTATSIMDEAPKILIEEAQAAGKTIVLPLVQKALGGIGGLHYVTAGFSLIAWALDTMDTHKKNSDGFIELSRKVIHLLKSTRKIWRSSTEKEVEILQDGVFKAFQCADLCSRIMLNKPPLFRFLGASGIEKSIENLNKELDLAFQQIKDFVLIELYDERPKNPVQPILISNQEMVGEDDVKQNAMACLNEDCSEVVAVCLHGMGGIGKSTVGKRIFAEFQGKGALTCIFSELPLGATDHNLLEMQKDIVGKLIKRRVNFHNITDGVAHLKEALGKYRGPPVFLFLDNVLEEAHVSELLPEAPCFPKGSRILVTTRNDENVRRGLGTLKIKRCKSFEVKKLDKWLAKKLLWSQIEECKHEPEQLERDAAKTLFWRQIEEWESEVLGLCDGLPLALTVVAGYIKAQGPSNPKVWKQVSESMRKAEAPDGGAKDKLYSRLQFSIDNLNPSTRKAFLDVVAFAVGWRWEDAERLVEPMYLENLQKLAFVRLLDRDLAGRTETAVNTVGVHDVLKTMGLLMAEADVKEIRVISQDALDDVSPSALVNVVGLKNVTVEAERFQDMPRLRVLHRVKIEGECQSAKLRHLSVVDMTCATAWPFNIGACTALKTLTWEWAGVNERNLGLKVLNCSKNVLQLSISKWSLEAYKDSSNCFCCKFKVEYDGLKFVPEGVAGWTGLTSLDLSMCEGLQALPGTVSLDMTRCRDLQGVGGWTGWTSLDLSKCDSLEFKALPKGVASWTGWTSLDLSQCAFLEALPEEVAGWKSLTSLDWTLCRGLQKLPEGVAGWTSLTSLDLSQCYGLMELPEGVVGWKSLTSLKMTWCEGLTALPEGVAGWTSLTSLNLGGCSNLAALPEGVASWTGLTSLVLGVCSSLETLPEGVASWTGLTSLDLYDCDSLQALPEGVARWKGLTSLTLGRGSNLPALPEGGACWTSLTHLYLVEDEEMENEEVICPPELASLTGLEIGYADGIY